MSSKLITPPSTEIITLSEAKAHLRVVGTDDDGYINTLITAAREVCEISSGQAMVTQTWRTTLDSFPSAIELTMTPVQSVSSIKYLDISGNLQTLNPSNYTLDNSSDYKSHWVVPSYGYTWPDTYDVINAVQVEYIAGFTTIPQSYKHWMLTVIAHLYRNRESTTELNLQPLAQLGSLITRKKVWYG